MVLTVLSNSCTPHSHPALLYPGNTRWESNPCSSAALPREPGVVLCCRAVKCHLCTWEFCQHRSLSLRSPEDAKASKPSVLTRARSAGSQQHKSLSDAFSFCDLGWRFHPLIFAMQMTSLVCFKMLVYLPGSI